MEKFITKTQAEELKKKIPHKKSYQLGELHPYVFDYKSNQPKIDDEDFKIVSLLGTYILKKSSRSISISPFTPEGFGSLTANPSSGH